MENFSNCLIMILKKIVLQILIISKPPVFLTLSILLIIGYLTFVVLKSILDETINYLLSKQPGDPTLILLLFIILFGACWIFFFLSLASYEIDNELDYYLRVFRSSKKGLRCLPVTIMHLLFAFSFEYLIYTTVNNSIPKDKPIQNLSGLHPKYNNEKFHAVFVYTLWTCSIIYSFFYFLFEEFVIIFCREDTVVEFIHLQVIRLLFYLFHLDLSELLLPSGDHDQSLERLMNPIENYNYIPPSQAEYNPVRQRMIFKPLFKKTQQNPKDQKYLSWNTIR